MKIWSMCITELFGFVTAQEDAQRECWFFHSKKQGRKIAGLLDRDDNTDLFVEDVGNSDLPDEAEIDPLNIKGRVVDTMTWLVEPLAKVARGQFKLPKAKKRKQISFLLTPRPEDVDPCALLGFTDETGDDYILIFFSRSKGRDIIRDYTGWASESLKGRCLNIIGSSVLPDEAELNVIRVGEPISACLHYGYKLRKQS